MNDAPVVEMHEGIMVVRDDLFGVGTKCRYIPTLFQFADEVVYASPCEGGAQAALAYTARQLGKRCTIFVAERKKPHPRSLMAKALGAKVLQVGPAGYLSVVQSRARAYAAARGAFLAPFGLDIPAAGPAIAQAAISAGLLPREIWCAGGSGTLARGLRLAWPGAALHVVQVGHRLDADAIGATRVHVHELAFGEPCRSRPPFDSDQHYDAKAWEMLLRQRPDPNDRDGVAFWNVAGRPVAV